MSDAPAEFFEKQRELAAYLFRIAYGGSMTIEQVALDPSYGPEYFENYLADAADVLRDMPHLLSLETREAMHLYPRPSQARFAAKQPPTA